MTKTKLGLDQNIEGALCYLLLWISGIVFYLLEEDNKFIRFHALQSIFTFLPLSIVAWFLGGFFGFGFWWGPGLFFFWILGTVVWLITIILWLILMLKAYTGEKFKLPFVGDIAEKNA
jgi:uncharacterized membrane protein